MHLICRASFGTAVIPALHRLGVRTLLRTVFSRTLFRTLWAPMFESIRPSLFILVVRPRTLFSFPHIRLSRLPMVPKSLAICPRRVLRSRLLMARWTLLSPPVPLVRRVATPLVRAPCSLLSPRAPVVLRSRSCRARTRRRLSRFRVSAVSTSRIEARSALSMSWTVAQPRLVTVVRSVVKLPVRVLSRRRT